MGNDHAPGTEYMAHALRLAGRGLGNVWPNPAVGCVLVKEGRVIGRGWTQPGGRPHAETEALKQAGKEARGATAYVTLEPCAHHGKTAPCAEALIKAGVAACVIACQDPDPRVAGKGIRMLEKAGVAVATGMLGKEAKALNAGFFSRILRKRPWVALKLATTQDGKIATSAGESQWITGEPARNYGHLLRAQYDAILTGSGTALADDPRLTCRLPGLEHRSPVRVALDSSLRLSATSALARQAKTHPLWVFTTVKDAKKHASLTKRGAEIIPLRQEGVSALSHGERGGDSRGEGKLPLARLLEALAERGITRMLVEAGPRLTTAFLAEDLADRLYWFRSPALMGGDGLAATGGLGVQTLQQLRRFRRAETRILGEDMLEILERSA